VLFVPVDSDCACFSVFVSTLPCATAPIFQTRLIVTTPVLPFQSCKLKEYCFTIQAPSRSAIFSYSLLAYDTSIFACVNMYSTFDAVGAIVIMTIRAVFERLVGSRIKRSSRTGRRVILVDVPIAQLDQLAY
jgi:hypothetical protein